MSKIKVKDKPDSNQRL